AALRHYGSRGAGRYRVPGHKGGLGIDPEFREALGESALELDIPLVIPGVDVGASPTPFDEALELAADAWGARRTWFLSNGATQGSHAICVALAGLGTEVVVQRNVHASTIDGLILAGLRPTWVAPELNPELGIAHCPTAESLEITLADSPDAVGVIVVSPTYYGVVADVRALADVAHGWGVPLIVDEAWGSHFPFHPALPKHPSVYDYDPLRLAIDVRGVGASGYELAALLRGGSDDHLELCSENLLVAVFGIAEPVRAAIDRLIRGLKTAVEQLSDRTRGRRRRPLH